MTVFVFEGNSTLPQIVQANWVLYCDDPAQQETLLDPIQLFAVGIAVDLTPAMFATLKVSMGSKGC
jgi:hypothetical protein